MTLWNASKLEVWYDGDIFVTAFCKDLLLIIDNTFLLLFVPKNIISNSVSKVNLTVPFLNHFRLILP